MTMRSWVVLMVAAVTMVGIGGCGGGGVSAPTDTSATTTPSGAPGSVSASVGSTVPLGITPARLEERLGPPASAVHRYRDGFDCSLYLMSEQPPFVKLRYCFRGGRLKFFSTYAVEGR